MRGGDRNTGALFSYVSCEERVAKDHPRAIGEITNAALAALSPEFEKLYARLGRPSIAPEKSCGRCCCKRSTRCVRSGS